MSFGFSVGDFIVLTQLASNVVQGARQACGAHDELTREVISLHIVLRQLEREVAKPQSILNSNDDDRKLELTTLADHCQKSLKVLSNILDKYNVLSEEKRRVTKFWKRVQFGNGEMQDLSKLRLELSTHTNVITLFLNLLSVGSLGKVEEQMVSHGEELRAVRRSVNWVTASVQASAGHGEGSILTSYSDDDKGFWKEFRRKMVKDGLTSRVVRKHETLIMNYVKELGDRGALDELPPLEEVPVEDSEPDAGDGSLGVRSEESNADETPSLAASNEMEEPTPIDSPFVPEIITEELPLGEVRVEEMNGHDTEFLDMANEQDFDNRHQDRTRMTLQQEEQQREVLRCLCNGKWHGTKDCPKDEETNRLLETAKQAGWQRCYSCRTMVELKNLCNNHMTCRCTAEFCMICGLEWKSCNCPWFNFVEADRLNNMQIPMPAEQLEQPEHRPNRLRRPRPNNYYDEINQRRRQERADKELARRLQRVTLEDDDDGGIGDIHGIGNGAAHFMRGQEERILEEQRHGEWRQEGLKEDQIRRRERRRVEWTRDELKREEVRQEELREKQSRDGDAGVNDGTPTPPISRGRLGGQIEVPRSVFIGNPDGSWQRVFKHHFTGDNSQSSPAADQNNTGDPNRATVEEVEDESLSSREYPVHEHVDGVPTYYAINSLDFVLHHLETRGYDPTNDREEVFYNGDIFVVPRLGDPLYVGFGRPQFAYNQDGAQVAVTGTPGNLVVQDQGAVPTAPQAPNFTPQRSPRATDIRTPPPIMSIGIAGDRARDYARAYVSAARRMLDAPPFSLPPRRKATESDARRNRIPPGYSLREWDPDEEPIMVLTSVFDSFSLGKWIYDWAAFHHGAATPIGDMAGDLWVLLIQLSATVKTSEECMPRIRHQENREMLEDFIESGERLMDKLKILVKTCEALMIKAGKGKGAWHEDGIGVKLGQKAGTEFIDTIFGRDRQLEATEKWMTSVRLWNLRFDANCASILRNPRTS